MSALATIIALSAFPAGIAFGVLSARWSYRGDLGPATTALVIGLGMFNLVSQGLLNIANAVAGALK